MCVQCLQMIFKCNEIVLKEKFYENDISYIIYIITFLLSNSNYDTPIELKE
jgi:hypothetical protein